MKCRWTCMLSPKNDDTNGENVHILSFFLVLTIFSAKNDYILWPIPNLLRCLGKAGIRFTKCCAFAWQPAIHRQGWVFPHGFRPPMAYHWRQVSLDEVISSPAKFCHELKSHGYAIVQCNLLRRFIFFLWEDLTGMVLHPRIAIFGGTFLWKMVNVAKCEGGWRWVKWKVWKH